MTLLSSTTALPTGSFRRQLVVLTACVTAFAMLLLTVVLQLILADLSRSNVDRVLEDRADAVVSSAISATTGQELVVPAAALDVGVVVYDELRQPVVGLPTRGLRSAYDGLGRVRSTRYDDPNKSFRLVAEPFTTTTGVRGVVVVSERLAPYEEAESYALIVSLVTGLLATAAAASLAAWVSSRALRPVATLTSTAADWSEHDLSRRFGLGPPTNEITALAAVLDTLLDKVSAAIRGEQRLTSELAHELRTPLTAVLGAADLSLMQDDLSPQARENLEEVAAGARRMSTTITTMLDLARSESAMLDAASCELTEVVAEVVEAVPAGDVRIEVELPDQRIGAPHAIVHRALAPVVENAVRFARSRVRISSDTSHASFVLVTVDDDGPGVSSGVDDIFVPGTTSYGGSGAGLGLAIARRMTRSIGGDVELAQPQDPTRFVIRVPRA